MDDPWSERPSGAEQPGADEDPLRFTREAWEALGLGDASRGGPGGEQQGEPRCVPLCPICRAADALRAAGAPPELRGQLHELQREGLLTLRALLDHYIERLDREPGGSAGIEEIPIE